MKNKISRFEFLKGSFFIVSSIKFIPLLSGFFYSCSKIFEPDCNDCDEESANISDQITLNISDYSVLENSGGSVALDPNEIEGLPSKGILIYRNSESEILVYDRKCPHQQAKIGAFQDGISTCPLHSAKFNIGGECQSGPCMSETCKNLESYDASIHNEVITIFLNQKSDGCT